MTTMTSTNIVSQLNEGVITFKYTKEDGTVRTANGTTLLSKLPEAARATISGEINPDPSVDKITYWDTDKGEFRAFKRSKLIS